MSERRVSREQFDAVLRRASELAAQDVGHDEGTLSESELLRIAGEVGLPEHHVRRALTELEHAPASTTVLDRVMGPSEVVVGRVVPGSAEDLADRIDEFLVGGRLLQRLRRSPTVLQFRPSVDWISQFARAASGTARKYFVASARSVQVTFEPAGEGSTKVVFAVDPGIRSDHVLGAIAWGGTGALASGVGAGAAIASVGPFEAAVVGGVAAAGGVSWLATGVAARAHRRKYAHVQAEIEGILDQLERGEALEPPPRAWRTWVERQFHGARRLLEPNDVS
jgi:hypothetical protein